MGTTLPAIRLGWPALGANSDSEERLYTWHTQKIDPLVKTDKRRITGLMLGLFHNPKDTLALCCGARSRTTAMCPHGLVLCELAGSLGSRTARAL